MIRMIRFSLLLLLVTLLIACSSEQSETSKNSNDDAEDVSDEITISASSIGGFWYTLASGISEEMGDVFPDSLITIVEGGSISNVLGLQDDIFTLGFTSGPFLSAAENGTEPFDEQISNISTIATFYPTDFHLVVREDSDIYEVADLKDKIVSPGIKGYGGELIFKDILDVYGMSYDDLSGIEYIGTADAADLLRDRHIDAIAGILAVPNAILEELDTTVGIRLIPIDDDKVEMLGEINDGYISNMIEGGSYPSNDEDILTVASYTLLAVNENLMGEDDVYKLTKMLFEKRDQWEALSPAMKHFSPEYSIKYNVGEINPGAEKYYKEIGALD